MTECTEVATEDKNKIKTNLSIKNVVQNLRFSILSHCTKLLQVSNRNPIIKLFSASSLHHSEAVSVRI